MPPRPRITNWSHCNDSEELGPLSTSKPRFESCNSLTNSCPVDCLPKPARALAFCPFVAVREIESLDDYSTEETHACWYNDDEIAAIKTSIKHLARGGTIEQECSDLRGLESHIYPASVTYRSIKMASIDAVLEEQELQRRSGVTDPDLIRACYKCVTCRLHNRATEMAANDALEAQRIRHDNLTEGHIEKCKSTNVCWMFDISRWFPKRTAFVASQHRI
jgi:hypothetical protein